MNETVKLDDKLAANRYKTNETASHIVLSGGLFSRVEKLRVIRACPAGLYSLDENGALCLSYLGCLECGACRALGLGNVIKSWDYPESGYGVEYRQG